VGSTVSFFVELAVAEDLDRTSRPWTRRASRSACSFTVARVETLEIGQVDGDVTTGNGT
jgi:hypothetical protein